MSQEDTHRDPSHEEHGDGSEGRAFKKNRRRIFYGDFWANHPVSILGLLLGGVLVAPITNFPGGQKKDFWYVACGLTVLFAVFVFWFIDGLLKLHLPTDEEIEQQRERREAKHKRHVESSLLSLDDRLATTERKITEQEPRSLADSEVAAIQKAISFYPRQNVSIISLLSDDEGAMYAQDFATVFKKSGWNVVRTGFSTFAPDFRNVMVSISLADHTSGNRPPATASLVVVLHQLNLTQDADTIHIRGDIGAGELGLIVGPHRKGKRPV